MRHHYKRLTINSSRLNICCLYGNVIIVKLEYILLVRSHTSSFEIEESATMHISFFFFFFLFWGGMRKFIWVIKKNSKKKKRLKILWTEKLLKISLKTQKNKTSFSFLSPSSLLFFSSCTSKAPSITLSALRRTRLMAQRCSACR